MIATMSRWSISSRSSGVSDSEHRERPRRGRRQAVSDPDPLAAGEAQHECPRGSRCASATRDEDGTLHPLLVNSAFCPADESAIGDVIPGLPESWERLAAQMTDPYRSRGPSSGGRRPPGSRVLLDAGDDALLRESAKVLGGWASRVRSVPGIQHSPRQHDPFTLAGVTESCDVLAKFTTQMLALPPGPVTRTWEYLPGRESSRRPAAVCRHCGAFVTSSPSGKHWWPAVCTHAMVLPSAWAEKPDGTRFPVAWACTECATPFRGSPPRPRPACTHEPASAAPPRPGGIPADVEAEIEGLEVVRAGDGWVTVLTDLSGVDAGLDVLELAARFRRRLQEGLSRPETLDGIPCRDGACQAFGLERAPLGAGPGGEREPVFSRCPACGDLMTRAEYDEWAAWYAAWAAGEDRACTRCERGRCGECQWKGCACRAAGHAAA